MPIKSGLSASVVQLDRITGFDPVGCGFDSYQACHSSDILTNFLNYTKNMLSNTISIKNKIPKYPFTVKNALSILLKSLFTK